MQTTSVKAAEPQIRPFGKLRNGGKPPDTMTTTLYINKSLHSRIEARPLSCKYTDKNFWDDFWKLSSLNQSNHVAVFLT